MTKQNALLSIINTLLFIVFGWILLVLLNMILLRISLNPLLYVVIQSLYMALAGIMLFKVVNRRGKMLKKISLERNHNYNHPFKTQLAVWLVILTVVIISDYYKLDYLIIFLRALSSILSPTNPNSVFYVFLSVGFYIMPFIFISIMAISYTLTKYFYIKRAVE